jgi:hypothetical protein
MRAVLTLVAFLVLACGPVLADINLTVPESVRSEIGGSGTANYDKIRTTRIEVDPQDNTLFATIEIYSSSDAALPAYEGTYIVNTESSQARLEIPGLAFQTGLTLTAPQVTSVINSIDSHRDNVESSMISFGVVDGTQE